MEFLEHKQKCYRMIFDLIANDCYQSNIFICVCSCVGALRYFCSVYLVSSSSFSSSLKFVIECSFRIRWISNPSSLPCLLFSIQKNVLFRKTSIKYTHYPLPYGVCVCVLFSFFSSKWRFQKNLPMTWINHLLYLLFFVRWQIEWIRLKLKRFVVEKVYAPFRL